MSAKLLFLNEWPCNNIIIHTSVQSFCHNFAIFWSWWHLHSSRQICIWDFKLWIFCSSFARLSVFFHLIKAKHMLCMPTIRLCIMEISQCNTHKSSFKSWTRRLVNLQSPMQWLKSYCLGWKKVEQYFWTRTIFFQKKREEKKWSWLDDCVPRWS